MPRAADPPLPPLPPLPPPPRRLPPSLQAVLMLRHPLGFFGWIIGSIGLVVAMVFAAFSEPLVDPFGDDAQRGLGRVTKVEATGGRVNGRRVRRVVFEWPASEPRHVGTAYTDATPPAPGAEIAIDWLPGDPPRARAVGMRSALMPASVRFVFAFPVLGAGLVVAGALAGWRRVRALRDGEFVHGTLVAAKRTAVQINNKRVHQLTYRYTDAIGAGQELRVRSMRFGPLGATTVLAHVPGAKAVVKLDDLPITPRVGQDGAFEPPSFGPLAVALLPPTAAALAWSLAQALVAAIG
jgi:hypothetical protein